MRASGCAACKKLHERGTAGDEVEFGDEDEDEDEDEVEFEVGDEVEFEFEYEFGRACQGSRVRTSLTASRSGAARRVEA